jgi:hypothetical protein
MVKRQYVVQASRGHQHAIGANQYVVSHQHAFRAGQQWSPGPTASSPSTATEHQQPQAQPQIKSEFTPVRAAGYSHEGEEEMTDLLQNIIVAASRQTRVRLPAHAQRSNEPTNESNRAAKKRPVLENGEPREQSNLVKKSRRAASTSTGDSSENEKGA